MKQASRIESLFPTLVYRVELPSAARLNMSLAPAALALAQHDRVGQRWCLEHGYLGYTSFASIDDLGRRNRSFSRLEKAIEKHAGLFAKALNWDLRGGRPLCDTMWVNIMPEGAAHGGHIHTNAVMSGTYYVTVPEGSSPLVVEDPRQAMMMAAPPRKAGAPRELQMQVSMRPRPGTLILWESWLRHEVPLNRSIGERISVSFNLVIAPKS